MRTTLQIDDDVLAAARALARASDRSIGTVISELARRGLRPGAPEPGDDDGFPRFRVAVDAPPIDDDMVAAALDER
jgi:hypothetical protein